MAAALGEEAVVPVCKEVHQLRSVTDLKHTGDDGGCHK
jgi:hypothetical protein